jgi:hypothetical protein
MQQQIETAKDMPYNVQNYVDIKNNKKLHKIRNKNKINCTGIE